MEYESRLKKESENRWHKELASRLIQKAESIEKARNEMTKLIETKKVLLSKLEGKNEEIHRLNGKVLLLLRELSSLKTNHQKALEEIKMLKNEADESARKNELMEQDKRLRDKMQKELSKPQQLLTGDKLKTRCLSDELKWQTMEYADPHHFKILQRKNYLQNELQKKLDEMKSENVELLDQKNTLLKNFKNTPQSKLFKSTEDTKHMMEFYKTIQLHNKKLKVLTAQVDMFDSVFSNQHKLL